MWVSPSVSLRFSATVPETVTQGLMMSSRSSWYTLASGSPVRHAGALLAARVEAGTGGAEVAASGSTMSSAKVTGGAVVVGAAVVAGTDGGVGADRLLAAAVFVGF